MTLYYGTSNLEVFPDGGVSEMPSAVIMCDLQGNVTEIHANGLAIDVGKFIGSHVSKIEDAIGSPQVTEIINASEYLVYSTYKNQKSGWVCMVGIDRNGLVAEVKSFFYYD